MHVPATLPAVDSKHELGIARRKVDPVAKDAVIHCYLGDLKTVIAYEQVHPHVGRVTLLELVHARCSR